MDKDEQAPATPPVTPEVEKPEEPKTEAPKEEAPVENNVAAEMDKLLKEDATKVTPAPESQPMIGKKHNHIGIIILLSILVLLSVGFAIFVYFTAGQGKECDCPKCETPECNCEKEEEEEEETSASDYIYVSEWGVKIKLPDDWNTSLSRYDYLNGHPQAVSGITIYERVDGTDEASIANSVVISQSFEETCDSTPEEGEEDVRLCVEVNDDVHLDVLINNGISEAFSSHFSDTENYSEI
ncbi:hypothetical protein IJI94_00420 [Candidatus Saccharibacteria bacterium]|nr:hypothetical protein [Candidatus Saccharibacteria bacterium]